MKIFSLETKRAWLGWSVVLGVILYCIDRFTPFAELGIARCGPGYYVFPRGNRTLANLCETSGDLDAVVTSSQLLTLLFWISLPLIILGLARYSRLYRRKRVSAASIDQNG